MGDDEGASLAALIAHYGFLSMFPLILFFSAILGFVFGSDPAFKAQVIRTIARSFPSLSGFIGTHTQGNGLALGVGALIAWWAGLKVTRATERALDSVWNVPASERPNLWRSRLRGMAMLGILGIVFLVSTALAGVQQIGGVLDASTAVLGVAGPLALNFGLYLVAFQVLTNRHVSWRAVVPGAAAGAVGWTILQSLGALYVRHVVAHASQLYGTLDSVIGLLAWLYLGAILTLAAAEANVVLADHLWPRSLRGGAETDADRRALVMIARAHERVAGEVISVSFDGDPATAHPEGSQRARPATAPSEHHEASDLIAHLRAFDRCRWDYERSEDPASRRRFRSRMRTEAESLAHDLARMAAEEPILAKALGEVLG